MHDDKQPKILKRRHNGICHSAQLIERFTPKPGAAIKHKGQQFIFLFTSRKHLVHRQQIKNPAQSTLFSIFFLCIFSFLVFGPTSDTKPFTTSCLPPIFFIVCVRQTVAVCLFKQDVSKRLGRLASVLPFNFDKCSCCFDRGKKWKWNILWRLNCWCFWAWNFYWDVAAIRINSSSNTSLCVWVCESERLYF